MTKLMEQVIERLRAVPEGDQDAYARLVLHQLDEADPWVLSTARHADKLDRLLEEIDEARRRGELEDLDPDKL